MVPFKDTGRLAASEKRFNTTHSSARMVIERAFGLLKGRFRRLRCVEIVAVDELVSVITAICVVHNVCVIAESEDLEDFITTDEDTGVENSQSQMSDCMVSVKAGVQRRLQVMNDLPCRSKFEA